MTTPGPSRENAAPPLPDVAAGLSDLRALARGGYSIVYRAWQQSVGREVALKVDQRTLDNEQDQQRFLREAQAAGRMSGHPNIVHVYDAGVTPDNHPYLVMELCTGGSYADKLKAQQRLSPQQVRDVGVKIADALDAAHRAGILHRDVKPANILINRYDVAGLADFGLAVVRDASKNRSIPMDSLTPAYAAPEVFRLAQPTEAVDIYSLGATLYALLAGRPPRWPERGSVSPAQLVALHNQPLPALPQLDDDFFAVLTTAMATRPADRFDSAAALRDALIALALEPRRVAAPTASDAEAAGVEPGHTSTSLTRYSAPPLGHSFAERLANEEDADPLEQQHRSRRPMLLMVVLSVVLLALVGLGGFLAMRADDTAARQASEDKGDNCPIATQRVQCVSRPECFTELDPNAADYSSAASKQSIDCRRPHRWETFAIARIPEGEGVTKESYDRLREHPYVTTLCSRQTLERLVDESDRWATSSLLPPEAFFAAAKNDQSREDLRFRCVAGTAEPRSNSVFSR